MTDIRQILIYLAAFLIVAVAANQISKLFLRIRLPLVTGLLVIGILAGPDILGLISSDAVSHLGFIYDFSLGFIAMAVGSELYLNEIRSRLKSIAYMTASQMIITFILSSLGTFILTGLIPFLDVLKTNDRVAVSILTGTIFVARSPASAIAVINELRARGPFTQTVLGVSVMKEFLVIILFALTFATSVTLVKVIPFNIDFAGSMALELVLAFVLGYMFGKLLGLVISIKAHSWIKISVILLLGLGIFRFCHYLREITGEYFFAEIYIEPLLVCILGSFIVTNYSSHRPEFLKLMKEAGPPVYAVFFTIVGSTISLDVVSKAWMVALLLTVIRLVSLVIAGFTGGILAGDPLKFNKAAWAAYISPAGVSIGLTAIVAAEFQNWGNELASIILAVIILNQLIGPPLFKWALFYVGESHVRPDSAFTEIKGFAVLFGLENQSIALARQLKNHGLSLRDLRLPDDIIILSITRDDQMIISHGYTRLRLGDNLTMVGSRKSLEKVRGKFGR